MVFITLIKKETSISLICLFHICTFSSVFSLLTIRRRPNFWSNTWGHWSLVRIVDPSWGCLAPCRMCILIAMNSLNCTELVCYLQGLNRLDSSPQTFLQVYPSPLCKDIASDLLRTAHSYGQPQSYDRLWWGPSLPPGWTCTSYHSVAKWER